MTLKEKVKKAIVNRPRLNEVTIKKSTFKKFIHINFIVGILYAFYHFIRTPKYVDMPTRRLWAAETWIVFTLYSIFIYLFALEVSSEDGEPTLHKIFRIKKCIRINKNKEVVKNFFLKLNKQPELYTFDSHKGVTVTKGSLDKVGSEFYTVETFSFLKLKLFFTVTDIDNDMFEFSLQNPLRGYGIKGTFIIEEKNSSLSKLFLVVDTDTTNVFQHLILIPVLVFPFRILISRQLIKELTFIKRSIENN